MSTQPHWPKPVYVATGACIGDGSGGARGARAPPGFYRGGGTGGHNV